MILDEMADLFEELNKEKKHVNKLPILLTKKGNGSVG